ncbi:MAG: hypothetical protein ACOY3P_15405 [Planctomycetota bacterium]
MNKSHELLIEILARSDALWLPLRAADWAGRGCSQVLNERRAQFFAQGIGWRHGGDQNARQAHASLLAEASAAGLLRTYGNERRSAVKLTDMGDRVARGLAGCPGIAEAVEVMRRIAELELEPHGRSGGLHQPCVREDWVANTSITLANYDTDEAARAVMVVEDRLLPAMTRGWVESASDTAGAAFYSLTDLGRDILSRPPKPADLPKPARGGRKLYARQLWHERLRLREAEPADSRNVGLIPVPASVFLPVDRHDTEDLFFRFQREGDAVFA